MSYSLLWFVKINTELLRGVFTTQRFDTPMCVIPSTRLRGKIPKLLPPTIAMAKDVA